MPDFDPLTRLRRRNQRQKSDVAQKLIAMCLHEVSASLVRERPYLRVEAPDYEASVRRAFGSGCAFCSEPLGGDLHVEHLDAMNRVRAGLHVAGNVVLSCRRCNWAKRNDDQGKTALAGNDGWELFLRHSGAECPATCSTCEYWRGRYPDTQGRKTVLAVRRGQVRSFRAQYQLTAIRMASLEMVKELERVYRRWQQEAEASTEAFRDGQLSRLLDILPSSP